MIISALKSRLHADICQDPVLHGLVLNLYLNGEEYPHRVDDYFPLWAMNKSGLREQVAQHMRDEDKHVALYQKAIQKLEQPVVTIPTNDIYNHIIRRCTPTSWRVRRSDSVDRQSESQANFFAHLHYLEKRIARSLDFHLQACAKSPSTYPLKAVGIVHSDEQHHVQYTKDAVFDLLPRSKARAVLQMHKAAESKANRIFSGHQLEYLTSQYAARFPKWRCRIYRVAGQLLSWAGR